MGLLLTNFLVRLGSPFKLARACFTMRGPSGSRFATTASAEPVFLAAFLAVLATTFRTDLTETTDLFRFELMHRSISDNRAM